MRYLDNPCSSSKSNIPLMQVEEWVQVWVQRWVKVWVKQWVQVWGLAWAPMWVQVWAQALGLQGLLEQPLLRGHHLRSLLRLPPNFQNNSH
jgi:hypothetical protein